jgi:uncharacterized oxidoreductase
MATSAVAMGKVRVAKNEGKQVADGILIDPDGKPTRDPNVMYQERSGAAHVRRPQGLRARVVAELLAGALSGGPHAAARQHRHGGTINNFFAILVDPGRLAGLDWFRREVDGFVDYVKASRPPIPPSRCWCPAIPSVLLALARARDGITVDPTTWGDILEAGEKLGLARRDLEALVG